MTVDLEVARKLARAYGAQGKFHDARKVLSLVLKVTKPLHGTDDPETLQVWTEIVKFERSRPPRFSYWRIGDTIDQIIAHSGRTATTQKSDETDTVSCCDEEVVELLLDLRESSGVIPEYMVVAAAANLVHGVSVMRHLIEDKATEVRITEAIVEEAAGNPWQGDGILEILLKQRGAEFRVTEALVDKAVGNLWCGERIVKLLIAIIVERSQSRPTLRS